MPCDELCAPLTLCRYTQFETRFSCFESNGAYSFSLRVAVALGYKELSTLTHFVGHQATAAALHVSRYTTIHPPSPDALFRVCDATNAEDATVLPFMSRNVWSSLVVAWFLQMYNYIVIQSSTTDGALYTKRLRRILILFKVAACNVRQCIYCVIGIFGDILFVLLGWLPTHINNELIVDITICTVLCRLERVWL